MYILIQRDEDPLSPREDRCTFGTMAMRARSRFTFAEETIYDKEVFLTNKVEEANPEFISGLDETENDMGDMDFDVACDWENRRAQALADEFNRLYIHVPIYVFEHGNVALSSSPFSCQWDSGQVGMNLVTREKAAEELGSNTYPMDLWGVVVNSIEEHAVLILRVEIKEVHQYINGEVYGYEVYNDNGEVVDSCWGFYSDNYGEDWETNGMVEHWSDKAKGAAIYMRRCYGHPDELLRAADESTLDTHPSAGD